MKWMLAILLFLVACNPVNKILKTEDAFNRLGQKWSEANPCANDTTIQTKSDTTSRDTVEHWINGSVFSSHDPFEGVNRQGTFALPVSQGNGPVKTIIRTRMRTITIHIRDTVNHYIRDDRAEKAARDQVAELRPQLQLIREHDKKATKWEIILVAALTLSIAGNFILFIKKFFP